MKQLVTVTAIAAACLLSACAPTPHAVPVATHAALPDSFSTTSANATATVHEGWWKLLGDAQLNALVDEALAHNSDLQQALARVEEARANWGVADAARLPTVDATLTSSTSRSFDTTGLHHSRAMQPGVQASWEPDLWGRIASQTQAAHSKLAASQADRDAVALSVVATTVQTWTGLLSLQEQVRTTEATAQSRAKALQLAQDQQRVGYTSQLQMSQAEAEYENVQQQLQALQWALRKQENALNVLLGTAGRHFARSAGRLDALQMPPVPQALPSDLLNRRPDIARAQHLLAASDAAMAVQRAAFMPQVRLSASVGSLMVNALDFDPVKLWSLGGSVLAPVFNAGRLQAQLDAATAQRDQAAWAYRSVVLNAFADVENALTGTERLAQQLQHAEQRVAVLERNVGFAQDRYQAGYASHLEVLDAQRNQYAAQLEVVRVRQQVLDNRVALYKALGGGWQK